MRTKIVIVASSLLLALLLVTVTGFAAENVQFMKNGKRAEVVLSATARVGDITLQPGRYRIQHLVEGDRHVMHFRFLDGVRQEYDAEVKCDVDPDGKSWPDTRVSYKSGTEPRTIGKIQIGGEKVIYLFD
jgi:hypothetical protein